MNNFFTSQSFLICILFLAQSIQAMEEGPIELVTKFKSLDDKTLEQVLVDIHKSVSHQQYYMFGIALLLILFAAIVVWAIMLNKENDRLETELKQVKFDFVKLEKQRVALLLGQTDNDEKWMEKFLKTADINEVTPPKEQLKKVKKKLEEDLKKEEKKNRKMEAKKEAAANPPDPLTLSNTQANVSSNMAPLINTPQAPASPYGNPAASQQYGYGQIGQKNPYASYQY